MQSANIHPVEEKTFTRKNAVQFVFYLSYSAGLIVDSIVIVHPEYNIYMYMVTVYQTYRILNYTEEKILRTSYKLFKLI